MSVSTLTPQDAFVPLNYLKRCEIYKVLRPYTLGFELDPTFPTNNLVFEAGPPEKITDIRAILGELSLEKNGFFMAEHEFKQPATDTETINKPGGHLDELKKFVRDTLTSQNIEVERVHIINWVVSYTYKHGE